MRINCLMSISKSSKSGDFGVGTNFKVLLKRVIWSLLRDLADKLITLTDFISEGVDLDVVLKN